MIQLIYWLMPVKSPNGWTLALAQESMGGVQPIVGLVKFTDKKELPQVAEMLHAYVMKLYNDWGEVVTDEQSPTDIPNAFLEGWDEGENP